MRIVLEVIAIIIILFDIFMITPFGLWWILKNLDEGSPVYGIIIVFISAIPLMIILNSLGWIK